MVPRLHLRFQYFAYEKFVLMYVVCGKEKREKMVKGKEKERIHKQKPSTKVQLDIRFFEKTIMF